MSLEHDTQFHFVKRLVKIVAAEYRVFSTSELEYDQCVLDTKQKTIEIGEGTEITTAVAAILFQAGHLRLIKHNMFKDHFGDIDLKSKDEPELLKRLCIQGSTADQMALEWASTVLSSNWNIKLEKSKGILERFVWNEDEWNKYYTKDIK